jgi:hypothetical protein
MRRREDEDGVTSTLSTESTLTQREAAQIERANASGRTPVVL